MSASILPLFFRATVQYDWTQQELAEFYRVETVLIQSGVSLETDRGLSDEGDPWFVFCRPQTGDVIVHFARHGSDYIAAGGALDGVLRGRSFRDIIDSFMSRQPIVVSGGKSPETTLLLHPAALLSAFVATAFFLFTNSDAEAAQDAKAQDADALDPKETQAAAPSSHARMPAAFQVLIEAAGLAGNRDAWMTLSTVAIAFSLGVSGLQEDSQADESARLDPQILEGSIAEAQLLQRNDAGGKNAEPNALVQWANVHLDAEDGLLLSDTQIEDAGKTSIIPAIDLRISGARFKDSDLPNADKIAAVVNVGAAGSQEPASSQIRSLEDSLGVSSFLDAASPGADAILMAEAASDAYSLLLEAKISHHSAPSTFLTQALINAIAATPRTEGRLNDYVTAEINFADNSINLAVFDADKAQQRGKGPSAEISNLANADPHTSAILALEWFTQSHPDFKVVSLGRNVVVFDWSTIDKVQETVELHTWTMHDGSTINIIGSLPEAFSIAA